MRQFSEAMMRALRTIAGGHTVPPDRFHALMQAGLVDRRGRGRSGRWWLTEAGNRLLTTVQRGRRNRLATGS